MARFPIRFTGVNTAMVVLGITRGGSYVDVDDSTFTVRMTWAFRAPCPARRCSRSTTTTRRRGGGVHTGGVVDGW